jgi:hypothetical protein
MKKLRISIKWKLTILIGKGINLNLKLDFRIIKKLARSTPMK